MHPFTCTGMPCVNPAHASPPPSRLATLLGSALLSTVQLAERAATLHRCIRRVVREIRAMGGGR